MFSFIWKPIIPLQITTVQNVLSLCVLSRLLLYLPLSLCPLKLGSCSFANNFSILTCLKILNTFYKGALTKSCWSVVYTGLHRILLSVNILSPFKRRKCHTWIWCIKKRQENGWQTSDLLRNQIGAQKMVTSPAAVYRKAWTLALLYGIFKWRKGEVDECMWSLK